MSRGRPAAPPDAHTIFEIGLITKIFTATVLADMAREALVALDTEPSPGALGVDQLVLRSSY
jgi:CubicO group peptidase (beta-lactamase class C family)